MLNMRKHLVNNNFWRYSNGHLTRHRPHMTTDNSVSLIDVAKRIYAEKGERLSIRDIAQRMNVSREWVRRFIASDIPNPGVRTVEAFIKAVNELANA